MELQTKRNLFRCLNWAELALHDVRKFFQFRDQNNLSGAKSSHIFCSTWISWGIPDFFIFLRFEFQCQKTLRFDEFSFQFLKPTVRTKSCCFFKTWALAPNVQEQSLLEGWISRRLKNSSFKCILAKKTVKKIEKNIA